MLETLENLIPAALLIVMYKMSFYHKYLEKILDFGLGCTFFKKSQQFELFQGFLTPFAFGTSAQILLNLFKRVRGKSKNPIFGKGTFSLGLFLGSFGGLYKVRLLM